MSDIHRVPDQAIDTLRMSDREIVALLSQLDSRKKKPELDGRGDARADARTVFRVNARVPVILHYPTGQIVTHTVVTRNISRSGMGFLDGMFCYPGSSCRVVLHSNDGQRVEIPGHVIRCGLVTGRVHEAAVQFDEPIDPARFLLKNVA